MDQAGQNDASTNADQSNLLATVLAAEARLAQANLLPYGTHESASQAVWRHTTHTHTRSTPQQRDRSSGGENGHSRDNGDDTPNHSSLGRRGPRGGMLQVKDLHVHKTTRGSVDIKVDYTRPKISIDNLNDASIERILQNRHERKSDSQSAISDEQRALELSERDAIRRQWKEQEKKRERERAQLETHEVAKSNDPYKLLSHANHLDRILAQRRSRLSNSNSSNTHARTYTDAHTSSPLPQPNSSSSSSLTFVHTPTYDRLMRSSGGSAHHSEGFSPSSAYGYSSGGSASVASSVLDAELNDDLNNDELASEGELGTHANATRSYRDRMKSITGHLAQAEKSLAQVNQDMDARMKNPQSNLNVDPPAPPVPPKALKENLLKKSTKTKTKLKGEEEAKTEAARGDEHNRANARQEKELVVQQQQHEQQSFTLSASDGASIIQRNWRATHSGSAGSPIANTGGNHDYGNELANDLMKYGFLTDKSRQSNNNNTGKATKEDHSKTSTNLAAVDIELVSDLLYPKDSGNYYAASTSATSVSARHSHHHSDTNHAHANSNHRWGAGQKDGVNSTKSANYYTIRQMEKDESVHKLVLGMKNRIDELECELKKSRTSAKQFEKLSKQTQEMYDKLEASFSSVASAASEKSGKGNMNKSTSKGKTGSGGKAEKNSNADLKAQSRFHPDSNQADEFQELLRKGAIFLKYGRFGKPHPRWVRMSPDLRKLVWSELGTSKMAVEVRVTTERSVPVKTISNIVLGQSTKVFRRFSESRAKRAHCCFSLITAKRTIDLELFVPFSDDDPNCVHSEREERDKWVAALRSVIPPQTAEERRLYVEETMRRFDDDGGGTISRQELGTLLTAMGLPGINREKFNEIDVDRSGELSLEELMTYLNSVS